MINDTGKLVIGLTVLMLAILSVFWLVLEGDPANSLHVSALGWSYTLIIVILGAIGLGAVLPTTIDALRK